MIGLLLIATGEKYWGYADALIRSARVYLPSHQSLLWTDKPGRSTANWVFRKNALGHPEETLRRYHTFLEYKKLLSCYDYLFYCDVDMRFVAPVREEEILADGITATLHPGYVGTTGTPERRPKSRAVISHMANNKYFCGGFNGGTTKAFLDMAETIKSRVDADAIENITAIWHDESHLNRYLYDNPPAKILTPEFCYPDVNTSFYTDKWTEAGLGLVRPKLFALEKPR